MSGEMDLRTLIASMRPTLQEGVFVFATAPASPRPEARAAAVMIFREREGETLILPRAVAEAQGLRHEFPCRMITLEVHSALAAVGFLARIAARLAELGAASNAVSAFFHDHLFVSAERAEEVLTALKRMAEEAGDGAD